MSSINDYYVALFYFTRYGDQSGYPKEEIQEMHRALTPEDRAEVDRPKITSVHFREPIPSHNNFGIELRTDDPVAYHTFVAWARKEFGNKYIDDPEYEESQSFGAFFQGDVPGKWFYIEFWHEQTVEFRAKVESKIREVKRMLGLTD